MTPFTYRKGESHYHRLDPRYKLIMLALVSVSVLQAAFIPLLVFSAALAQAMVRVGIHIPTALKHLKFFFLLLLLIFLARTVSEQSGDTLFKIYKLQVTTGGIRLGVLTAWRFLVVMLAGMIFSRSTRPSQVKSAAQWFLKPVPFIPEKRAAVMIGLAIRFLPLILQQAEELSLARKARGGDLRKNPVKRITELAVGLMKKSFRTADQTALAMAARGFSEDRTDPSFHPSRLDAAYLVLTGTTAILLFVC
ncbi:MAG: energy-coupling factor transporter transmembrane protein EcfT [Desulfarculaceae bacterium]|nr:energy-coupling factor transporter transmembrane protein EcfT [Desulfarculaceae bacterium]